MILGLNVRRASFDRNGHRRVSAVEPCDYISAEAGEPARSTKDGRFSPSRRSQDYKDSSLFSSRRLKKRPVPANSSQSAEAGRSIKKNVKPPLSR
jgi:hypothetical protein